MRVWRSGWMRRLAGSVMLLAALAFLQQGVVVTVAHAAAAVGIMPEPAVTLKGDVHFHGDPSRHVHVHSSHDARGHVHHQASDDESTDGGLKLSFNCATAVAVLPVVAPDVAAEPPKPAVVAAVVRALVGFEPSGLIHPPSTPGIA